MVLSENEILILKDHVCRNHIEQDNAGWTDSELQILTWKREMEWRRIYQGHPKGEYWKKLLLRRGTEKELV